MVSDKCVRCNYNTKKTKSAYQYRRQLSGPSYAWHKDTLQLEGRDVSEQSLFYSKCRSEMNRVHEIPPLQEVTPPLNVTVPLPNISQAGKSKGACVICRTPYKSDITTCIPLNTRLDTLIMFYMFVADGCVNCLSHLDKKNLKADTDIPIAPRQPSAELEPEDASDVIRELLAVTQTSRNRPYLDFLDPSMSDEDYITWTGWNKAQFNNMLDYLVDMRSTTNRNKTSALAIFWVKMKTGLSLRPRTNSHLIQFTPCSATVLCCSCYSLR